MFRKAVAKTHTFAVTGPKSKRSVTADVLEKLLHACVLERFVDVRDHALLLLPLLPAGGAAPSG